MIIGLIGKPNTGKSTFFNACTLSNAEMASYPFTTIKPNIGIGHVKIYCVCNELNIKDNPINSYCTGKYRFIPVKIIDIAGLVPGASSGRGLGNKFLDDIRQADVLIHVIDASGSTDKEGKVTTIGSQDLLTDIEFIESEFDNWLYNLIENEWTNIIKISIGNKKKFTELICKKLSGLSIKENDILKCLDITKLKGEKSQEWKVKDIKKFIKQIRLITKPIIIAANKIDLLNSKRELDVLIKVEKKFIPTASEAELLLRKAKENSYINYIPGESSFEINPQKELSEEQKKALNKVKQKIFDIWNGTGVQEVINHSFFELLKMITVYPVEDENNLMDKKGNVLPDAYLIPKGSNPLDLAYKIHTDLGKRFLYAINAKTKKRLASDYQIIDNDIIKIVST